MKRLLKDQHTLRALGQAKCELQRAILHSCDNHLIQSLAEIIHNVLSGNIDIDPAILKKLQRHKTELRKLHHFIRRNKSIRSRRREFKNQVGGFWPILIEAALSSLLAYGGQKLAEYAA